MWPNKVVNTTVLTAVLPAALTAEFGLAAPKVVVLRVAVLRVAALRFAVLRLAVLRMAVLRLAVLRLAVLGLAVLRFAVLRVAVLTPVLTVDKGVAKDVLGLLRTTTSICKGVVDQWGLVHVVLQCLSIEDSGKAWEVSFIQVNMHPKHRLSFEDWIKKLVKKGTMQSGDTFQHEGEVDHFSMLPDFWKGMKPAERVQVIDVVRSHESEFSVACLQQLHTTCSVPYSDMQKLRVCYVVSEEFPDTVQNGFPTVEPVISGEAQAEQHRLSELYSNRSTDGLINFQLKPPGMQGLELLDHMTLYAKRRLQTGEKLQPSSSLDVFMTSDQQLLFNPSVQDLTVREILKDAGGMVLSRRWPRGSWILPLLWMLSVVTPTASYE
jgi:hypothetical protein